MVRVMAIWPSDVLDFCVPLDESAAQVENGGEQGDFVYAVRLTLEDPTARLHVFLYGEDAVRLLVPEEEDSNCSFEKSFHDRTLYGADCAFSTAG